MKNRLSLKINLLSVLYFLLSLTVFAQTEDKIVSISGDLTRSGTYVYQGTRDSYHGEAGVQTRPYYKMGGYYLYADYVNGQYDFYYGFNWHIASSITSPAISMDGDYFGWDEGGEMNFPASTGPEYSWYWYNSSGYEVTVTVSNAPSGAAPDVSTLEASLVTTTSGTMNGNLISDGGETTSKGFVYSSLDNTPTLTELNGTTVFQVTGGTGTGTYTDVISSLVPGGTYYYQAYGQNSYGTTYGGVKSFTTPTTSSPNKYVSGITNYTAANGVYVWIGTYYEKPAWKHETLNYWVYYSRLGTYNPTAHNWYIDNQLREDHGTGDYYFYHADAATCPSSGWASGSGNGTGTGTPSVIDYPQVDFTSGASYSPGNPTAGTINNPIGRFQLDADISGATLTTVTISLTGTRTGISNLKLWSSTDMTFNAGSDLQLNSQYDGTTVTFSGFSSAISTSVTTYFITADLISTSSGTLTLSIGSKANLTYSGGASSTVITNSPLTNNPLTITLSREINIIGGSVSIGNGDTFPNLTNHTDFGNANIALGSVVNTFTIENLAPGILTLTAPSPYVVISGATTEFSLTSPPPGTISGNSSATFQVTFNPNSIGLKVATISIANDDTDENPYNFSIQGTGLAAPTITTQDVSNIGTTNAIGNGNITDLGAPNPSAYGICWGTSENPTILDNRIDKGATSVTGAFSAQMTNLTAGATYHVRAFATNTIGTTYGEDKTFTTSPVLTAPGHALHFDGTDDYVVATDIDNSLTAFTIEAWVKWTPSSTSDVQFICGKGMEQMELHTGGGAGANGVRFIPTTRVYLDAYNVLPTEIWTHVAAVYEPSTITAKMYINGEEVSLTKSGTGNIGDATGDNATLFYLGRRSDNMYHFNGSIDEIRVWNTQRSQAEIQNSWKSAIASSSGLLCSYNFNEGTAGGDNTTGSTMLPDLTGNGNNGTINYFALNGSISNWVESYALVVPTIAPATDAYSISFRANWIAPEVGTVDNYKLEVATDAAFTNHVPGYNSYTVASPNVSASVTGLLSNTTYYYRVRADKNSVAGQGAWSGVETVTTPYPTSSTFRTAGNWSNPSNWSSSLPGTTTDVTIDANGTMDGNNHIKSMVINTGKVLTIAPNQTLIVSQIIMNNSGTTGLVIESDETGTGKLVNNTNDIPATIKQFIEGDVRTSTSSQWHYFSLPIEGTPAVETFFNDLFVIQHDESKIETESWNYLVINNSIQQATGYGIWTEENKTIAFAGNLNTGTITFTTNYTNPHAGQAGWNFIGNPYPCTIDWEMINDNIMNVNDAIYVWNQATEGENKYGRYGTYNDGIQLNFQTNLIAPMQGFFVRANAANGSVTFTDAAKTVEASTFKSAATQSILRLALSDANGATDESVIRIHPLATTDFDGKFDAYKLKTNSLTPQLYSVNKKIEYSINSIPEITKEVTIPLKVLLKTTGVHRLDLKETNNFHSGLPVLLLDEQGNVLADLQTEEYVFNVLKKEEKTFILSFAHPLGVSAYSSTAAKIFVVVDENILKINRVENILAEVIVSNVLGQTIYHNRVKSRELSIPIPKPGLYIVKVKSENEVVYNEKAIVKF